MEQQPDRRHHRRFSLQQPAILKYGDGEASQLTAVTENVSLGGVLLSTESAIPDQSPVNVHILLQKQGLQDVVVEGTGVVIRTREGTNGKVNIAIALEKPLSTGHLLE